MRINTNTDHVARRFEWQAQYVGLGDRIQLESLIGGKGVYGEAVYTIVEYITDETDVLVTLLTSLGSEVVTIMPVTQRVFLNTDHIL